MTPREQLADKLDDMHIQPLSWEGACENSRLIGQAAAELRKVCRTCEAWGGNRPSGYTYQATECDDDVIVCVPADGSGFCHRWTPRTAAPEGNV